MSCDTAPIEYLLEQGANPHIKDKFGLTAFDYAIRNPNKWAGMLNYLTLKYIKNGYIV